MKYLFTILFVSLIFTGYTLNMYYLTVDENIRKHHWINKVGIVIVPLGSVMGFVYIIDQKNKIK